MGTKTIPIPDEFKFLGTRLVEQKLMSRFPEQLIINEYEPGQGIAAHTDHTKHFDDQIVSISLLSDIAMHFEQISSPRALTEILLKRNSCVVLSGDSRYDWKHSIAKRKTDQFPGKMIRRGRRISLTFRHMLGNE